MQFGAAVIDGSFVLALDSTGAERWVLPLGRDTRDVRVTLGSGDRIFVAWKDAARGVGFAGMVDREGHLAGTHRLAPGASFEQLAVDHRDRMAFISRVEPGTTNIAVGDAAGRALFEETSSDTLLFGVTEGPRNGWLLAGSGSGDLDVCGVHHTGMMSFRPSSGAYLMVRRPERAAGGFIAELARGGALEAIRWLPRSETLNAVAVAPDGSIVVAGTQEIKPDEGPFEGFWTPRFEDFVARLPAP
jgi:hypothetical protein